MPFFNFRKGTSSSANAQANAQPESMEVIRKRAKHRLIGSAVLVLAGVVGFPLLFDTQPRPIALDIPIEIPAKNSVTPLGAATKQDASPVKTAPSTARSAPPSAASVAAQSSLTSKEEIVAEKPTITAPIIPVAPVISAPIAPKKEAKSDPKEDLKSLNPKPPEPKPDPKPPLKIPRETAQTFKAHIKTNISHARFAC